MHSFVTAAKNMTCSSEDNTTIIISKMKSIVIIDNL